MVSVSSSKLPGHPYTSTVSLADANKKAENAVRGSDGQAYANKNGGCTWTYVASRDSIGTIAPEAGLVRE